MPRTKVAKANKRNRAASDREEKMREFDPILDGYLNALETQGQEFITEVEGEVRRLVERTQTVVLQLKLGDFLEMKLGKFSDWHGSAAQSSQSSICNSSATANSLMRSIKATNPNDEGYLTEDSTNGGGRSLSSAGGTSSLAAFTSSISRPVQQPPQYGRTPGPLSSARARRPRRSRSACGDIGPLSSAIHNNQQSLDRSSRNKLRTPTAAPRHKAFSVDRASKVVVGAGSGGANFSSPPSAFIRWPKPGELVLSTCGSPLVAQVMPDKFANVNIPVRNGVFSLRPKALSELKAGIIESIDPETLNQLKMLRGNLDLIMSMADRAANK